MTILAKSVKDHEYLYIASTSRAVSARSAKQILDVVNHYGYLLKENEIWCMHEVDEYDNGYYFAQHQRFTIRKGVVSDVTC